MNQWVIVIIGLGAGDTPWILSWTYNHSVAITVGPNATARIEIPIKSLKGFWSQAPVSGDGWQNHWWYLTGHVLRLDWSALVTTQEGSYWAPGSSKEAQFFKDRVTLKHDSDKLVMTFALDGGSIRPPNANIFNTSCWGFLLWAWHSGADPYFPVVVCVNDTMRSTDQPKMTNQTRQAGVNVSSVSLDDVDGWFQMVTGISGTFNNWLLMAEQAGNVSGGDCVVCMGPRPLLQVVPAPLSIDCMMLVMNATVPGGNCTGWDKIFPVTKEEKNKPIFSSRVARGNFTCVNLTGAGEQFGRVKEDWCNHTYPVGSKFAPVPRADLWWWCGDNKLFDRLPHNVIGLCALTSLLLPVTITPMSADELISTVGTVIPKEWPTRKRRDTPWLSTHDPTYIDAIGVPRGIPDEYKLVDQVKSGFESSLCWWCTINKNVDRINYIHYNVQRLGNWTQSGFEAVHEQLAATSLMTFQNRIATDMLLAKEGGVCAIFGDQCCTFIPNNTAAGGSQTKALEGLRTLNGKMKEHSGVDTSMWDNWMEVFGKYKSLVSSVLLSIAVFASLLTVCGCCCIPCIRALLSRLITTVIAPAPQDRAHMFPLLGVQHTDDEDEDNRGYENIPK